jgi:hypothetical protein
MDRLLPDPLPQWLTVALLAVVAVGFVGGLLMAIIPERKRMSNQKPPTAGGFSGNQISIGRISNCKTAVQIVNDDRSVFEANTLDVETVDCERALDIQNAGKMRANKFKVVAKTTKPEKEG